MTDTPELATSLIATFLGSVVLALLLTPLVRAIAHRVGAVASPKQDRWHRTSTALLGGVAIWTAVVIPALLSGHMDRGSLQALVAGTSLFVLGLFDDFVSLQPSTKLTIQLLIACLLIAAGGAGVWTGVPLLDALISIGWIVGITNAFNLIDNMDGLAAGVAAIAAGALCLSIRPGEHAFAVIAAAIAGASLGFLRYNFYPASVFMGDCGSLFIGSALAMITLRVEHHHSVSTASTLAFPVVLLLTPIFDTAFVTLSRRLSARAASQGGRDHTSHRLVAVGFSEAKAVLLLYLFAGLSGAAALLVRRLSTAEGTLVTAVLVLGLTLIGIWLARVNVYGDEDFVLLKNSSLTPLLIEVTYKRRIFEIILDFLLIGLAYSASYVIRFDELAPAYLGQAVRSLPIVLACHLGGFFFAGVYRGTWRYVGLADVSTYVNGLLIGGVGSVLILLYAERFEGYSRGVFIINGILLGILMLAARLSFRALGEFASRHRSTGRRALIYGAGDGGMILVREIRTNAHYDFRVLGFLDDNPTKWSRHIAGLSVVGGGPQLATLIERHQPDSVLLSTTLGDTRLQELHGICARTGTTILKLEFRLETVVMPELIEAASPSKRSGRAYADRHDESVQP
jgi:UDP-GlcNAc:undecaprenyl-phosphate GlcNAc-1-phosphate transferase